MQTILLRWVSISVALLAISASAQTTTVTEPKFSADHAIALKSGDGATTFTLNNQGPTLALTAGPVVDAITNTVLPKAKAVLTPVSGASAGSTSNPGLAAGKSVTYEATVTGVSGTSEATVDVFDGDVDLGTLRMAEIDAPLGVAIEGDGGPNQTPLAFIWHEPVAIALKNNDAESYHIRWKLLVAGKDEGHDDLYIPPNGMSHIYVKPTSDVFSVYDRLHPSSQEGDLLLSVVGPADLPAGLLPGRSLPVNLVMRRVSPSASTFLSYVYAGLFLLMGGILSIVASSVLPNMQRKAELRGQIKALANRTSSVSNRIDSYLRVLLRLERKRIEIANREISAWLPASADPLSQISVSIATLDRRLTATEHLDDLRRKHEQASSTAPPSVSESIDTQLQAAAEQLHSLSLSDINLATANACLAKAEASLAMLDDDAALTKLIAAGVAGLNARMAKFPTDYCADLKEALPGIWVILDRGLDDPKNIVRPMFFAIDHGVAAIHLALDYAMVRGSVPAADSSSCTNPGQTVRERLAQRHCHLIDLLGTLSWRALREATNLVAQMREDIYEEDVLAEVAKPGQAELTYDTHLPRPFLPVFFTISFKDSRYTGSAAIQRMVCRWSFPDGLSEQNWKVWHYFTGNERIPAKPYLQAVPAPAPAATDAAATEQSSAPPAPPSRLRKLKHALHVGKPPAPFLSKLAIHASVHGQKLGVGQTAADSPLSTSIQIQRYAAKERARFFAEFLRFAIAFGVALAGLLSGALGQLEKLDLIPATVAILALGFGADSIKNLLTQAPKSSASVKG